jgi:hypothetical protein
VPWKYAFKGNLDSYNSRKRRKEREEEHWRQMMEQRLKEQEEKMQLEIERRLAVTISQIALPEVPLDPFISPSTRKGSCASTEVAPGACIEDAPGACTEGLEEPRAIEGVPVDDNQQYPVDFLCRCTPCELHKPFRQHHNAGGVPECFCTFSWTD